MFQRLQALEAIGVFAFQKDFSPTGGIPLSDKGGYYQSLLYRSI